MIKQYAFFAQNEFPPRRSVFTLNIQDRKLLPFLRRSRQSRPGDIKLVTGCAAAFSPGGTSINQIRPKALRNARFLDLLTLKFRQRPDIVANAVLNDPDNVKGEVIIRVFRLRLGEIVTLTITTASGWTRTTNIRRNEEIRLNANFSNLSGVQDDWVDQVAVNLGGTQNAGSTVRLKGTVLVSGIKSL